LSIVVIFLAQKKKRDKFMCKRKEKKRQAKPDRKPTVVREKGVARKALKVTVCIGFLSLLPANAKTNEQEHHTNPHTPPHGIHKPAEIPRKRKILQKKPAFQIPPTELFLNPSESPRIFPISPAPPPPWGRFADRTRREFQVPYAEW
jgi:hypothetical protein